ILLIVMIPVVTRNAMHGRIFSVMHFAYLSLSAINCGRFNHNMCSYWSHQHHNITTYRCMYINCVIQHAVPWMISCRIPELANFAICINKTEVKDIWRHQYKSSSNDAFSFFEVIKIELLTFHIQFITVVPKLFPMAAPLPNPDFSRLPVSNSKKCTLQNSDSQ